MYAIKNYMEEAVANMLDRVIENIDVCKCQKCKLDIMALALNRLPARYFVTKEGELFEKLSELEDQFYVDIVVAITAAAFVVKNNPKHN
ncbi:competence protein ComFB [Caldicellulosiruptor changbaiensis]|uniref:Competence protein ComFB n=1 Tax=Caldicellulosiruptor changbaiensis TaxID=1222016 RepID=A0A3T0D6X4_9FIRM|nr:late competence development ComFB family protein [Caldicellulosiruptor changbaiensis]AZT90860.1 competence protein ComFB [Caldicellulosiruptor changbaiensis]